MLALVLLSVKFLAVGQSNSRSIAFLDEFRDPTLEITKDFLEFTRYELLNGATSKSIQKKESMLADIAKKKSQITEIDLFNGQDRLKTAYGHYFEALQSCLNALLVNKAIEVEKFNKDSARLHQEILVSQLETMLQASSHVHTEVQLFCIGNHVVGERTSGALLSKQNEVIQLIKFAVGIKNEVIGIRLLNRQFFEALVEDTGHTAEKIRQELVDKATIAKENIQSIPNFPGDRKLKVTGWNNVFYYFRYAARPYTRLVYFRERQQEFKTMFEEHEQQHKKPDYDPEPYFRAVKLFSTDIDKNQKVLKSLNKKRKAMEESFDKHFLDFIKDKFVF